MGNVRTEGVLRADTEFVGVGVTYTEGLGPDLILALPPSPSSPCLS